MDALTIRIQYVATSGVYMLYVNGEWVCNCSAINLPEKIEAAMDEFLAGKPLEF